MSKQCSVCGKVIVVGTKCMDCIKKEQENAERGKQTEAMTYKRLVARMCIAATILIALVGCVWIVYDSHLKNGTSENTDSYSAADENNGYDYSGNTVVDDTSEEDVSTTNTGTIATETNKIFGSWINTNNNSTWTFMENEYVIDYTNAFPGDYSDDAISVRQLEPMRVPCRYDGDYIIFKMGNVSYRNEYTVSDDTLIMKNSVSGGKTVYKRESTNSNNKANKNTSSINNDTNSNTGSNTNIFYRVRKSAEDAASQIGAFNELDRAKALADRCKADGYKVYDNSGNLIYAP